MGKWYGKIGFAVTEETRPGIYQEKITDYEYQGDVTRNPNSRYQNSGGVNDNINITQMISILADPFANQNFYNIRYIEYAGAKWKVESVEVRYPRLELTIGGLYTNG